MSIMQKVWPLVAMLVLLSLAGCTGPGASERGSIGDDQAQATSEPLATPDLEATVAAQVAATLAAQPPTVPPTEEVAPPEPVVEATATVAPSPTGLPTSTPTPLPTIAPPTATMAPLPAPEAPVQAAPEAGSVEVATPAPSGDAVTVADLFVYPGSTRLDDDDPHVAAVVEEFQSQTSVPLDVVLYTLPRGTTFDNVSTYYRQVLSGTGWQRSPDAEYIPNVLVYDEASLGQRIVLFYYDSPDAPQPLFLIATNITIE